MRTKEIKPVKKVHLAIFHIAGFGFWEGCEAFEHLKVGTRLELVRESNNAFDPYAVAIYYGEYKLGFIPRGSNHDISKYLDMGLTEIYDVRITRITPDVHPEQQVEVIVNILNQNYSSDCHGNAESHHPGLSAQDQSVQPHHPGQVRIDGRYPPGSDQWP